MTRSSETRLRLDVRASQDRQAWSAGAPNPPSAPMLVASAGQAPAAMREGRGDPVDSPILGFSSLNCRAGAVCIAPGLFHR